MARVVGIGKQSRDNENNKNNYWVLVKFMEKARRQQKH